VVTGALDEGELALHTVEREMREEVGVASVDRSFAPLFVGGWQYARARDFRFNDNFKCFALRAASEEIVPCQKEIHDARWFPVAGLLQSWRVAGAPTPQDGRTFTPAEADARALGVPAELSKFSNNTMVWLDTYASGRGIPCMVVNGGKNGGDKVMIGVPPKL
jgi:ADP-ribose pyrophosphatase YjhB (NUDIX family)